MRKKLHRINSMQWINSKTLASDLRFCTSIQIFQCHVKGLIVIPLLMIRLWLDDVHILDCAAIIGSNKQRLIIFRGYFWQHNNDIPWQKWSFWDERTPAREGVFSNSCWNANFKVLANSGVQSSHFELAISKSSEMAAEAMWYDSLNMSDQLTWRWRGGGGRGQHMVNNRWIGTQGWLCISRDCGCPRCVVACEVGGVVVVAPVLTQRVARPHGTHHRRPAGVVRQPGVKEVRLLTWRNWKGLKST